ncbi:hypothetical protein MVEN_01140000 [Mycena venus]|uniref:Uncharacterized protein n=1 Tax=Mycena venus TaxID=2733690 RepID=A0A8H7D0C5_9AGAR|nr:hypothetical protein MVEN_01140000 [Mycena venus]
MAPYAPDYSPPSSDITVDDFNDDENLAILRSMWRRVSELEAKEKMQAEKKASKQTPMKTFTNLGRCIHKVVSTFGSINSLIAESDRRQELEVERISGEEVHDEEEKPTRDQDRTFNGYKELIRFVPAIRKALVEAEPDEMSEIVTALRHGVRNARSDDTKNLKAAVVPWLQTLFPEMDPLDPDDRDDRGIYNEFLSRLLCPPEYDYSDEEIRVRIREGDPEYLVTAGSWWTGLYRDNQYDPLNPTKGLFENRLLIMVWKYIFTSPVSVKHTLAEISENQPPRTSDKRQKRKERAKASATPKRSVAAIIGLNRVSGRSIAYAAVQYRVAISDQHHWEENDGSFDYTEFYNNVVDYFEFPPGPIAKLEVEQLLDGWNSLVFRHHPTNWSLYEGGSAPKGSVMRMNAARTAREAGISSIPDMS